MHQHGRHRGYARLPRRSNCFTEEFTGSIPVSPITKLLKIEAGTRTMVRYHPSMDPAPAWVSYASLVIAAWAAVVSAGGVVVAYRSYTTSGPIIDFQLAILTIDGKTTRIALNAFNCGRGDVTLHMLCIESIEVVRRRIVRRHRNFSRYTINAKEILNGPELPCRLESGSLVTWEIAISTMREKFEKASRKTGKWDFDVALGLGDGRYVRLRSHDARRTSRLVWSKNARDSAL